LDDNTRKPVVTGAEAWDRDFARRALDELFRLAGEYKTTAEYRELLDFIGRFPAQRVNVRGIVSGIDEQEQIKKELVDFKDEAPQFVVKTFAADRYQKDIPHQKLIVIDGLLAFKGSANLTLNAWRKAAQGLELVEVVSDVEEVINLHNKYFSPVWAASATEEWEKKPIQMYNFPWGVYTR
jgi:phosphatidylserine/phosphatidylglycerophosphate/cardiolipin synthase-like enzyme